MPSESKKGAQELLTKYRAKRDFVITKEPSGSEDTAEKADQLSFCIQKHDATHLHYDFRLELDGVLKSWAVAKGPSFVPRERRLAVEVEDHPLAYGGFEGIIPKGQYGGGTVMLWDRGTWTPLEEPHAAFKKGAIKFELHGQKLTGHWTLVRMPPRPKDRNPNWLLIKEKDAIARLDGPSLPENDDESVLSGRTLEQIEADANKVWQSGKPEERAQAKEVGRKSKSKTAVLDFIEPELATPAETPPIGPEWLHEMKLDGYRLLVRVADGKPTLFTRRGLDWTKRFPEIREALTAMAQDAVIDGEVVVLKPDGTSDFSALQARLAGDGNAEMFFMAFDLLFFDGEDLRAKPLTVRKQRLRSILEPFQKRGRILYTDHVEGAGAVFLNEGCKAGLEGIISKRASSPYKSGRSGDWLKIKCGRGQEFVIGGFVPPSTGRGGIGSLSVGYYQDDKLVYVGRVGTGFSEAISRDLRRRLNELVNKTSPFAGRLPREAMRGVTWVKAELVAEIAYTGFTSEGSIRHGSFKGLREDKLAKDVVLEQPAAAATVPAAPAKQRAEAEVQGVRISHPDRVVDEESGLTKGGLADYYAAVADWILPHLKDRPLSFVRCPEGAGSACFYQRHLPAGIPSDVQPVHLTVKGEEETFLSINDLRGLLALVQFGALELHPWGAPNDHIDHPDRLTFDLDPDEEVSWATVVETAFVVRDRLKKQKLSSFVKTTGGKGLHVVAPLDGGQDWETVKGFAHRFAAHFAEEQPDHFVAVMSKKARKGKIFIDYLRNERSATAVSPYSTRARAGIPVATPLSWTELSSEVDPRGFTATAVMERLKKVKKDPWAGFFTKRGKISLA